MSAVYVGVADPMSRKNNPKVFVYWGMVFKSNMEGLYAGPLSTVVRVQRVGKSGLVFFAWLKHVWLNSGSFRNGGWPTD